MTPTSRSNRKARWFAFWLSLMVVLLVKPSYAQVERLTSWCLDSISHKLEPGPEDDLFIQCTPWRNRSCCTSNTTLLVHSNSPFNLDHCPEQNMSDACRRHFVQDHCFYECSPNVGPWVVKEDRSWRKERFHKVPLCASDCDAWFKDCENDYTCTDNWSRNFEWVDGANVCPANSRCFTFKQVYETAQNFCEKVWDDAWKYTSNKELCMRLWFDGSEYNPNDNVARIVAEERVLMAQINSASHPISLGFSLSLVMVLFGYL